MRYCILFLIFLLNYSPLSAQDSLLYKGKAYCVINNMLDDYPPYRDAVDSLQRISNHWCHHHYKATWLIEHDSLFLANLKDECPALGMQYGELSGKGRTFAWWVNEYVFATDTMRLNCSMNDGLPFYSRELAMHFVHGELYSERLHQYEGHDYNIPVYGYEVTNCASDSALRHIYAGIDWSQIPDSLLDEMISATVTFSTLEQYPFTADIKIRKAHSAALEENIRQAVAKLRFPRHYRMGKYMPVYYRVKLTFNQANKQRGELDGNHMLDYIQLRTR